MGFLLRICAALTMILFFGAVVVVGVARLNYHDPLAGYEAIMPGQPDDGFQGNPCQFRAAPRNRKFGYCQFDLQNSVFRQVLLSVSNHVITRMTAFDLRPDALHLGDLILCWGKPIDVVDNSPGQHDSVTVNLVWDNQVRAQVNLARHDAPVDEFLPITYLSIEDGSLPCRSA